MLRIVASADQPSTYCGKLLHITSGCIAIAEEFIQQCLRHQNARSTNPVSTAQSETKRKRRASNTSVLEVRAEKSRSPLNFSQQPVHLQPPGTAADAATPNPLLMQTAIQPVGATPGYVNMGYDEFGNNNFQDIFPGWPTADPESLSFLTDGYFWGGDETYQSLQQTPP